MATDGAAAGGRRGSLTLRQLLGELSLGELWGTVGAVVTLVVGAFLFGSWVKGREADLADSGRRNEINQIKSEWDLKLERQKLDAVKEKGEAEKDIARLKGEVDSLAFDRRVLNIKCEFLENCDRYYRTRGPNDNPVAEELFRGFYRRLAERPRDMKANGYVIHHGQSDAAKECKIEFADSAVLYAVPESVKGGAILTSSHLPKPK